jgi:hypothetical protein
VRLRRKLEFRLRYGADPADKLEVDEMEDPAAVLGRLRDGVAYGGYFQSERYFEGYEDEVRRLFTVRADHETAFAAKYGDLGPYTCVHMRRGDFFEWGPGGRALPTSYFLDAVASAGDHQVIVISDDLEHAAAEMAEVEGARFESNPAMVDLLLLMNASVAITSNSSFSWWGAWLNRRPGARVIAPRHWVGFPERSDRPRDVIAAGWETIEVEPVPKAREPS